jgi:apolipoprotein N-acyltransferase
MAMTTQLVEQGAKLIVWPETRYKGYFRYQHVAQAFAWQAKTLSTPILFQDTERTTIDAQEKMFNTAMIINQLGQAGGYYRKVHRVPFGEYIPGLNQFDSLKQVVYPYLDAFFTDYSAGSGPTALSLNDISLVPLICYEVMFSSYAAQAIGQQTRANKTSSNILVGLSNNGWFGESLQPYQHTNASQLRSVENRVSLIHVTNNGPSIVVSPSGRRLHQTQYHQRQAMLAQVPYANTAGGSFYSRFPGWFIRCIYVFVFVLSIYTLAQYFFIQTRAANR